MMETGVLETKRTTQQASKYVVTHQEGGFALLTVLIIVALVAILSSQLIYQQHLSISRSANMLHQAQSLSVAWGLEGWVKQGLKLDAEDNQVDHLEEMWSQPLLSVPFEGGEISGQLYDLQGRINLNNVLAEDKNQREIWQQVIDRWLLQVDSEASAVTTESGESLGGGSSVSLNQPLAEVLTDWVDADEERLPGGAESDSYLLMQPPYRAANQPMVMLEEIKLLQGFQQIGYQPWQRIKTTATALPTTTPINVNTAEKTVLMSLSEQMSEREVDSWLLQRKERPADNAAAFREFMALQTGRTATELNSLFPDWLIGVRSDYFLLMGQIDYGESQQGVSAIFYRAADGKVQLVQRWLSAG